MSNFLNGTLSGVTNHALSCQAPEIRAMYVDMMEAIFPGSFPEHFWAREDLLAGRMDWPINYDEGETIDGEHVPFSREECEKTYEKARQLGRDRAALLNVLLIVYRQDAVKKAAEALLPKDPYITDRWTEEQLRLGQVPGYSEFWNSFPHIRPVRDKDGFRPKWAVDGVGLEWEPIRELAAKVDAIVIAVVRAEEGESK